MKNKIADEINQIAIPKNLHERCLMGVKNVSKERENIPMKKSLLKRTVIAAAICVTCILVLGVTATATPIKGYFKDIIRFDGAVTGIEYLEATEEVGITTLEIKEENGQSMLPIEIVFHNKDVAPFNVQEAVCLGDYKIFDESGKELLSASCTVEDAVMGIVENGMAQIDLPIESEMLAERGNLTLVVETLYSTKKAEQPLAIRGEWTCQFNAE